MNQNQMIILRQLQMLTQQRQNNGNGPQFQIIAGNPPNASSQNVQQQGQATQILFQQQTNNQTSNNNNNQNQNTDSNSNHGHNNTNNGIQFQQPSTLQILQLAPQLNQQQQQQQRNNINNNPPNTSTSNNITNNGHPNNNPITQQNGNGTQLLQQQHTATNHRQNSRPNIQLTAASGQPNIAMLANNVMLRQLIRQRQQQQNNINNMNNGHNNTNQVNQQNNINNA
eukprot:96261_1